MNYGPFVFGSLWLVGRPLPGVAVSRASGKVAEPWNVLAAIVGRSGAVTKGGPVGPLPFELLQQAAKPFCASGRNCRIGSIGSWHCCPAALFDD